MEAALRCFARWGVAKTTLDDVAVEAGVGRSTVYRAYPGGKAALVDAATVHEVDRFVGEVDARLSAAVDLEEAVVAALVVGSSALTAWSSLRAVLFHHAESESGAGAGTYPEQALVLSQLHALLPPYLVRFVDDATAHDLVDWGARLAMSYALVPDRTRDLTDPAVARRLAVDLLLPAVHARLATRS